MVKGVIFDMDGLMFDTERLWDTLWEPACRELGLPLPPDMQKFTAGGRGLAGENLCRLVLEDSFNGIRAGRAAGCVTVRVPDLMQPTEEITRLYDRKCDDLLQVRDLLIEGKL